MKKVMVIPTEIYSRVVGYFRPVQNWNTGKQQEFTERKTFDLQKALRRVKPTSIPSEK